MKQLSLVTSAFILSACNTIPDNLDRHSVEQLTTQCQQVGQKNCDTLYGQWVQVEGILSTFEDEDNHIFDAELHPIGTTLPENRVTKKWIESQPDPISFKITRFNRKHLKNFDRKNVLVTGNIYGDCAKSGDFYRYSEVLFSDDIFFPIEALKLDKYCKDQPYIYLKKFKVREIKK